MSGAERPGQRMCAAFLAPTGSGGLPWGGIALPRCVITIAARGLVDRGCRHLTPQAVDQSISGKPARPRGSIRGASTRRTPCVAYRWSGIGQRCVLCHGRSGEGLTGRSAAAPVCDDRTTRAAAARPAAQRRLYLGAETRRLALPGLPPPRRRDRAAVPAAQIPHRVLPRSHHQPCSHRSPRARCWMASW